METGGVSEDRRLGQDLTKVAPFRLGSILIDPPARQLTAGTQAETIEPRVMRVLVTLGMAPGKVFSREDLIEQCWDGLIVGDNAIDRTISRLRRLFEQLGDGSVRLETVTKVGFRVVAEGTEQPATESPKPVPVPAAETKSADTTRPPRKWTRRAAIAGAVSVGAVMGTEYFTRSSPAPHSPALQAEELFRRGVSEANEATPSSLARAIKFFRRAVAVDPDYADAWAAMAAAYRDSANPFVRQPQSIRERLAGWAARRALALEPDHPEAQAVLLAFYPIFGRWAEQEARLRAMVLRFPDHWRTNHSLARMLFNVGRFDEAIPYAHRTIQLNMRYTLGWITLARILHGSGRDREADRAFAAGTALAPSPQLAMARFLTYMHGERYAQAARWMRNADERPANMDREQAEGFARQADALAEGRDAEYLVRNHILLAGYMAAPELARLGQWDKVFETLEGACLGGEFDSGVVEGGRVRVPPPGSLDERDTAMLFHPAILEKRTDPRYLSLLERTGLEDYWRKTGSLPDYRKS